MLEVNVKEARGKLSNLLDRVERGEDVVINRRGKKSLFWYLLKEKRPCQI
jgi:antitoxin (DNA-binding transcriptional repressor) of toxin-antitoxin stability system